MGDVVCFQSPQHQHKQLIKRVIAVNYMHTPQRVRVHSHLLREEDYKLLHVMEECAINSSTVNGSTINSNETVRIDRDHLARWREVPAGA